MFAQNNRLGSLSLGARFGPKAEYGRFKRGFSTFLRRHNVIAEHVQQLARPQAQRLLKYESCSSRARPRAARWSQISIERQTSFTKDTKGATPLHSALRTHATNR